MDQYRVLRASSKFFLAEDGSYSGAVEQIVHKLATDSTRKKMWSQLQIDYLKEHMTEEQPIHEISYKYTEEDVTIKTVRKLISHLLYFCQ